MTINHNILTTNIASVGASGTIPIWYVSDFSGGITILDGQITGTGAGTPVGLKLVTMSDANPPVIAGTVGRWGGTFSAGTITMGAGSVFEMTINTAFVQPGQWLAIQNTSGTTPGTSFVTLNYVFGA